ncbi:MAG: RodZ domain-containing protein [Pseudomonadota bacterium]
MNSEGLQGIGPRLAAAREAKGLATAEVAAKLRLGVRQIEALEADAYEQLPGEVFVRGFIRNYAKLLELDPDALLPSQEVAVSEQLTVPSTNVRFQPSPIQRWLVLPVGSAILVFALVALLYAWLSSGDQAAVEQPAPEMAAAPHGSQIVAPEPVILDPAQPAPGGAEPAAETQVPATTAAAEQPGAAVPANTPSVIDASKPVLPPLPPVAAKPVPEPVKPAPPAASAVPAPATGPRPAAAPVAPANPAPTPTLTPAPTPAASRGLVFQPMEDSWVQVVDAKGQRFSKLLRAGSTETLEGTPPFRLVIGNAASMKLSHNGKPVDLKPFIGEKVARLKLGEEGASRLNPPPLGSKPADGAGQ